MAAESTPRAAPESAAQLTANLLSSEATRTTAGRATDTVAVSDAQLPGVGSEAMTFRSGLAMGGWFTFVVLLVLSMFDELESAIFSVFGPDIRDAFGVGDGVIVFLGTASVAFFVLGAVPFGWLTDRVKRAPIVGIATLVFASFVFISGLAVNAFMMFWSRLGAGVSKANTLTANPSLLADTYPVEIRGRLFATTAFAARLGGALSPAAAGVIAAVTDADGWRWAFFVLSVPVAIAAFAGFRIPEPPRGQWEQREVLGELVESDQLQPTVEAAFARLWRIRTLRGMIVAFSAMGFFLFTGQSIFFLQLEDRYGLSAGERGIAGTLSGLGILALVPLVGRHFDRTFSVDPARAVRSIGWLIAPAAVLVPIQYAMPSVVGFVAVGALTGGLVGSAFSVINAATYAVVPPRLRGLGGAMTTMYVFLVGGVGAGLFGALLVDAFGRRTAITVIAMPALAIGAFLLIRSASAIRQDMALIVSELREEHEEAHRRAADPENLPAVQVSEVDVSYGTVQVLFGLSFEVKQGETLALLGTNGAGKSTILKVVAGLITPERGVVRLDGRTVTYSSAEQRAALGVELLPGGKGVFPHLSIYDNLLVGAYAYRGDPADMDRRVRAALERFPALAARQTTLAGQLSGGQQQMLALARVLLHEPRVLMIDELSLGLAPAVVQELLVVIEGLKAQGQTMIIVEQSLNVALAIADRAVFLEKGQVRFDGDAREMAARDDLARAVFLGVEGG